jgi:hypothetical protein
MDGFFRGRPAMHGYIAINVSQDFSTTKTTQMYVIFKVKTMISVQIAIGYSKKTIDFVNKLPTLNIENKYFKRKILNCRDN